MGRSQKGTDSTAPRSCTRITQAEVPDVANAERNQLVEWGVESYPTLFLRSEDSLIKTGSPTSSPQQLRELIDKHSWLRLGTLCCVDSTTILSFQPQ